MKTHLNRSIVACILLTIFLLADRAFGADYHFDRTISRAVLENYLSRSISMEGLLNGRGNFDDDVRMLKHTVPNSSGEACACGAARRIFSAISSGQSKRFPKFTTPIPT